MTTFNGPYTAPSATGLTQSVTRSGSMSADVSDIALTSQENYSKVYTVTFEIVSADPSSISITSTTPKIVLNRTGDVYTFTSEYTTDEGVVVNNWAYLKHCLRNLKIETSTAGTWPNPAFTINASISDGTTTLSGTISVSELEATTPTTPGNFVATRNWLSNVTLTWDASTQGAGPGIGGYYIFRDTVLIATVTSGTTYVDTAITNDPDAHTYEINAFDNSTPALVSAPATSITPAATTPTTPGNFVATRNWLSNVTLTWDASTQAIGPGVYGYRIYRDTVLIATVTSGTTYVDTAITDDPDAHTYEIGAFDLCVPENVSAPASANTPAATTPTAPVLTGERIFKDSVNLYWTESLQSVGPGIEEYLIYRDDVYLDTVSNSTFEYIDLTSGTVAREYFIRAKTYVSLTNDSNTVSLEPSTGFVILTKSSPHSVSMLLSNDGITWSNSNTDYYNWSSGTTIYPGKRFFIPTVDSTEVISTPDRTNIFDVTVSGHAYQDYVGDNSSTIIRCPYSASNTGIYSLDNGLTWNTMSMPATANWSYTKFGNSKFVSVGTLSGTNYIAYSSDGITWSSATVPSFSGFGISGLFFGNGLFLITSSTDIAAYSSDGITWTTTTIPIPSGTGSSTISNWECKIYEAGKFICTGGYTNPAVSYSSDGITWTSDLLPGTYLRGNLVYFDGKYCAIDDNGTGITYSSDGITWTNSSLGVSNFTGYKYLASDGTTLISTGFDSSNNYKTIYSTNVTSWSVSTMPSIPGIGVGGFSMPFYLE